jgi:hypothetical protein
MDDVYEASPRWWVGSPEALAELAKPVTVTAEEYERLKAEGWTN